jgi:hypothetical protein
MKVYKDILEKWGEKVPDAPIRFLHPCLFVFFLSIFFITTSTITSVHAVPIYIFNDLETEPEGNVLEVDSVETTQSKKSRYRLKIYPGETMQISRGSVLSFSISRLYPSHKVKYEVVCPDKGEDVTMSILEIHNNSIKGPCQLNKIGHWSRRTGLNWTQVKK